MMNIMAKMLSPIPPPSVQINTIWHVCCNENYKVHGVNMQSRNLFIALRTAGGIGTMICSRGEYILPPGSLLIIPAKEIIRYFCSEAEWEFWWCEYDAINPMEGFFENAPFHSGEMQALQQCFDTLSLPNQNAALASSLFAGVYAMWLQNISPSAFSYQPEMEKAAGFIMQNLTTCMEIEKIARFCNMSSRNFRKMFTTYFGMSPKEYIEHKKMQTAAQMLQNTSLSVGQIADALGYSSPYYFSRAYKKCHGLSPAFYRNKMMQR